ncbi:MFS transporter [Actinoplanes siamensis]|uniref:MFS-type transporter YfiS n=1 Tax=Actinoplanes siamensis TaxID=1223317 RepID=A0A919N6W9_9ACTN|nr:MFS transporter [Actinoplanes siamensis]GIF05431.1 putative MFS-type transporter YfiS [Actinoplanes siamensis]
MTGVGEQPKARLLRGNRAFAALWLARTSSYFGDFVTLTALVLYLYDRGASGTEMGVALAARALPQAFGPLAGTVADRWEPRRIMIACDLARVVSVGLIAVLLPPVEALIALIAVTSLLSTMFLPAGKSCVPLLVGRDRLGRANALLGFSHNIALATGPVIGAALMNWVGPRAAFGFDAGTYLVSALLLLALPGRLRRGAPAAGPGLLADLGAGLRYVARHRVVRAVALALFFSVLFAAMDNVALVYLVRGDEGGSAVSLGVATGVYGVAMVVAPMAIALSRRRFDGVTLLVTGLTLSGIGLTAVSFAAPLVLIVACYAIAGAGNGFENVGCDTVIGENVEEDKLGRVFGAVYGPIFLAETFASLLCGALLQATSSRTVFLVAGGGLLAVTLAVYLSARSARKHPDM